MPATAVSSLAAVYRKLAFRGARIDKRIGKDLVLTVLRILDDRCHPLSLGDLVAGEGQIVVEIPAEAPEHLTKGARFNNTERMVAQLEAALWKVFEPRWKKAIAKNMGGLAKDDRIALAENHSTPPSLLDKLARTPALLSAVLTNHSTPSVTLERVYNDPKLAILSPSSGKPDRQATLMYLAAHPNLPLPLYRKMARDPRTTYRVLDWLIMNEKHGSDPEALGAIFRHPKLERFQVYTMAVRETTPTTVLYAIASNRRVVDHKILNGLILNILSLRKQDPDKHATNALFAAANHPKSEYFHRVAIADSPRTPPAVLYGMACVQTQDPRVLARICWHPKVEIRTLRKIAEHRNTDTYKCLDRIVFLTPREPVYKAVDDSVLRAVARHPKVLRHALERIAKHPKASAATRRYASAKAPRAPRR